MTADIVNLRSVRKRKARNAKDKKAAENRSKFGRPKHESNLNAALREKDRRDIDGKKRDR